jgi:hypothetical protein
MVAPVLRTAAAKRAAAATAAKMNTANTLPKKQQGKINSASIVAVQTAQVIAGNTAHKNNTEVKQLLSTYEKGWIDGPKFAELLRKYLM